MDRVVGLRLMVELSVNQEIDPTAIADAVMEYLADGGDGIVPYPEDMIFSVDDVEVVRR
jgi:hypothetical protein